MLRIKSREFFQKIIYVNLFFIAPSIALIILVLVNQSKFINFYHGDALLTFNWAKICLEVGCPDFVYPTNTFLFPDLIITYLTSVLIQNKIILLAVNSALICFATGLALFDLSLKKSCAFVLVIALIQTLQNIFGANIGQVNPILAPYNLIIQWGHHTFTVVLGLFLLNPYLSMRGVEKTKSLMYLFVFLLLAISDGFTFYMVAIPTLALKLLQVTTLKYQKVNLTTSNNLAILFAATLGSCLLFLNKDLYLQYNFNVSLRVSFMDIFNFFSSLDQLKKHYFAVACFLVSLLNFLYLIYRRNYSFSALISISAIFSFMVAIATENVLTHRYYGILYLVPIVIIINALSQKNICTNIATNTITKIGLACSICAMVIMNIAILIKNPNNLDDAIFFSSLDTSLRDSISYKNKKLVYCRFWLSQQVNFYTNDLYCIPYEVINDKNEAHLWFVKKEYYDAALKMTDLFYLNDNGYSSHTLYTDWLAVPRSSLQFKIQKN